MRQGFNGARAELSILVSDCRFLNPGGIFRVSGFPGAVLNFETKTRREVHINYLYAVIVIRNATSLVRDAMR